MHFFKKISFLLIFFLVPIPFIGFNQGNLASLLIFYLLFITVPIVDYWVRDSSNPNDSEEKQLLHSTYFDAITFIYVPVQILFLCTALYLIHHTQLSWIEWIGFALSIGLLTGGLGINIAHEFMHKNTPTKQLASKILLSMVCYGHFMIEHVRGHHLRVATPDDPASARLGESVYQFLPRTILGSFKSAVSIEKHRLKQKKLPLYSYHNQFWWIVLGPLSIMMLCYLLGGWGVVFFFLAQAITAIFMLELVNYIEHYGLQRQKLPNGHYERVSPCHSWNANHWLSNILLLHLQRHSDHHTYGARPYQILRHLEESPQLPSGYLGMMFVALIPPLWHAIMDKRVCIYQSKLSSLDELNINNND